MILNDSSAVRGLPGLTPPRRLLLVDTHTLFRHGLAALLARSGQFEVVAQAGTVREGAALARELQPDVILFDLDFADGQGADAVTQLSEAGTASRLLVLTGSKDERDLAMAMKAGAHGYLLKDMDVDMLECQMTRALRGICVVSPAMTDLLAEVLHRALRDNGRLDPKPSLSLVECLSQRERDVLYELGRGASNKRIALTLGIAENTVKIHMQNIRRKLGVQSRVEAAMVVAQSAAAHGMHGALS